MSRQLPSEGGEFVAVAIENPFFPCMITGKTFRIGECSGYRGIGYDQVVSSLEGPAELAS